jgi:hypothetical protein
MSEQAPPAVEVDAPQDGDQTTDDQTPQSFDADYVKQLRGEAAKHRNEAKKNAAELERLRMESLSDTEKAVALAKAEARVEALREAGGRLVAAEFRAAAKGRVADVEALLEGVDRSRFVDDDGEPDVAAIAKWVDCIAPQPKEEPRPGFPDLGQGIRGGGRANDRSSIPIGDDDALLKDLKRAVGAP